MKQIVAHIDASWGEAVAEQVAAYLRERLFDAQVLHHEGQPFIRGRRGSLLGNMTAFDMRKVSTRIQVARANPDVVRVDLEIDTRYQSITEFNEAVWRLELVELRRLLLGRPLIPDVWARFRKRAWWSDAFWPLTFGWSGRMNREWRTEIAELELEDGGRHPRGVTVRLPEPQTF